MRRQKFSTKMPKGELSKTSTNNFPDYRRSQLGYGCGFESEGGECWYSEVRRKRRWRWPEPVLKELGCIAWSCHIQPSRMSCATHRPCCSVYILSGPLHSSLDLYISFTLPWQRISLIIKNLLMQVPSCNFSKSLFNILSS
jgi:hypothetical protein